MSAQIARITLTFAETGDVLFEQLWPAWLSHDHVSNNQNIEQELPFDTTKFRSEAVSSMLQVLSQLSREIDKGELSLVRFVPFSSSHSSMSVKHRSSHLITPGLGVSSDIQVRGSPRKPGLADDFNGHDRSRSKKSVKLSTQRNIVLIEEKEHADFVQSEEIFSQSSPDYAVFKEYLHSLLKDFQNKYAIKMSNLPTTPREKRSKDEGNEFPAFAKAIFKEFSTLTLSNYENTAKTKLRKGLKHDAESIKLEFPAFSSKISADDEKSPVEADIEEPFFASGSFPKN